jgi:hypothetical protein
MCLKSHTFKTSLQNYAENRQKLSKPTIMMTFVILGKAELGTENINGFNLAAARLMNAPVSKWPSCNISTICCRKPGLIKAFK